jgi:hypothetical protein
MAFASLIEAAVKSDLSKFGAALVVTGSREADSGECEV